MSGVRARWLLASESEVPAEDGWLSDSEREALAGLRAPSRRRDWRLGRWVAKHAVADVLGARPVAVELRAAPDGAPEALVAGRPAPVALSISHRAGLAACLVAGPGVSAGCDLELVEPHAAALPQTFFTPAELELVDRAGPAGRDLAVALIWSAKESALKALRQGLRLDTRDVEVVLDQGRVADAGWRPLAVRYGARTLGGWWRPHGRHVLTAVLAPAAGAGAPDKLG